MWSAGGMPQSWNTEVWYTMSTISCIITATYTKISDIFKHHVVNLVRGSLQKIHLDPKIKNTFWKSFDWSISNFFIAKVHSSICSKCCWHHWAADHNVMDEQIANMAALFPLSIVASTCWSLLAFVLPKILRAHCDFTDVSSSLNERANRFCPTSYVLFKHCY